MTRRSDFPADRTCARGPAIDAIGAIIAKHEHARQDLRFRHIGYGPLATLPDRVLIVMPLTIARPPLILMRSFHGDDALDQRSSVEVPVPRPHPHRCATAVMARISEKILRLEGGLMLGLLAEPQSRPEACACQP